MDHHHTINREEAEAARPMKGPAKDEVQNRVPRKLLLGILQALPAYIRRQAKTREELRDRQGRRVARGRRA